MPNKLTSEQLFGKQFSRFLDKQSKTTQGHTVDRCPIAPDDPTPVCYPSCSFWKDGWCQHSEAVRIIRNMSREGKARNPFGYSDID